MLLLFIGESLGMQELLLIGVIALIIFGPRKLPQIAKTIGKTMAEFRKATNEFKSTWEKEVDFEGLDRDDSPSTLGNTIAKEAPALQLPEIKPVDDASVADMVKNQENAEPKVAVESETGAAAEEPRDGKRDWL